MPVSQQKEEVFDPQSHVCRLDSADMHFQRPDRVILKPHGVGPATE
jgi:hypothetical protein